MPSFTYRVLNRRPKTEWTSGHLCQGRSALSKTRPGKHRRTKLRNHNMQRRTVRFWLKIKNIYDRMQWIVKVLGGLGYKSINSTVCNDRPMVNLPQLLPPLPINSWVSLFQVKLAKARHCASNFVQKPGFCWAFSLAIFKKNLLCGEQTANFWLRSYKDVSRPCGFKLQAEAKRLNQIVGWVMGDWEPEISSDVRISPAAHSWATLRTASFVYQIWICLWLRTLQKSWNFTTDFPWDTFCKGVIPHYCPRG